MPMKGPQIHRVKAYYAISRMKGISSPRCHLHPFPNRMRNNKNRALSAPRSPRSASSLELSLIATRAGHNHDPAPRRCLPQQSPLGEAQVVTAKIRKSCSVEQTVQ